MRAASAPANPLAPAMRTLGSATERPPDALQGVADRATDGSNLLVGEGALVSTELEAEGEALLSLADLVAAVEVEDLGAPKELAAGVGTALANALGRDVLGDDDGQVLEQRRMRQQVLVDLVAAAAASRSGATSNSNATPAGRSHSAATAG